MSYTTTALLTGVPTTAETDVSSTDELYGALAHGRRRAALDALEDGEELSVETLAERVLDDERGESGSVPGSGSTAEQGPTSESGSTSEPGPTPESGSTSETGTSTESRERVVISLVHVHLPKLAEADLVEYDRDRNRVAAR